MKPIISIIVPIYNVDKYLEKCIESILRQTFRAYELILVDDGATDTSPLICDKYAQQDDRIRVIHKSNGGLSSARNAGLNTMTGEYVAFIDSDDWIALDMLELLYENIVKYHADISQCEFVKVKQEKELDCCGNRSELPEVYTNIELLERFHAPDSIKFSVVWNKLYKKTLFQQLRFPEGKIHEDEFINYKLVYRAKRIVCSQNKLYFYRQRATSITGRKFNLSAMHKIEAYQQRKDFYARHRLERLYQKELLHLLKVISWMYGQMNGQMKSRKKELQLLRVLYRKTLFELIVSGYLKKEIGGYLLNCIRPDFYTKE